MIKVDDRGNSISERESMAVKGSSDGRLGQSPEEPSKPSQESGTFVPHQ